MTASAMVAIRLTVQVVLFIVLLLSSGFLTRPPGSARLKLYTASLLFPFSLHHFGVHPLLFSVPSAEKIGGTVVVCERQYGSIFVLVRFDAANPFAHPFTIRVRLPAAHVISLC
jgi:hypothetical protein